MGAVQILTHSMVQSIEENSVRKGYDPRDFALVAEGGAGPLFAAQIALEVGTPAVLVPPLPGDHGRDRPARDRHGLRVRRHDATSGCRRSTRRRCRRASTSSRSRRATQLDRGRDRRASSVVVQRIADCRYLGQGYELRVDAPAGRDRRRLGREGARPTSTTSTSASTRAASRSRTSRSRTSASAASA